MKFADQVRANYTPKENKPEKPTMEEIAESAREYVESVKKRLMENAQNGAISVKKGFLSSKKRVECCVTYTESPYIRVPAPDWYEGEMLSDRWQKCKDKETMQIWYKYVGEMIKEAGIKIDVSNYSAYSLDTSRYYINV